MLQRFERFVRCALTESLPKSNTLIPGLCRRKNIDQKGLCGAPSPEDDEENPINNHYCRLIHDLVLSKVLAADQGTEFIIQKNLHEVVLVNITTQREVLSITGGLVEPPIPRTNPTPTV